MVPFLFFHFLHFDKVKRLTKELKINFALVNLDFVKYHKVKLRT